MLTLTKRQQWAFALLLMLAAILAYQPVWHAGFIWDDNLLIVDDPLIKQAGGWWRVWCSKGLGYPVPAVSMVWWLEWQLWGNFPPAFHWVNLAFHLGAALLLWRVLRRLLIPGAELAAAIFALHPVNVATAAWVSEQKSTEALVFSLAAVWLYLQFEDSKKRKYYRLALGAFFLGLASKTAVAPLPLVLLGLAAWRRGRLEWRDIYRAIPFFCLSAVAAVLTVLIHAEGGMEAPLGQIGKMGRLARAGQAVWFYLWKLARPTNLVAIYPKWTIQTLNPLVYFPALALLALFAALWIFRKGWARPVLFGLGYFLLMLLPVLGFVDISLMRYTWVADHWQYFAMIGPAVLAAAALDASLAKNRTAGSLAIFIVLTAMAVLTWRQSRIYKSGEIFWAEFMRVNRPAIAACDEGSDLLSKGQRELALNRFQDAIRLQPAFAPAYDGVGRIYMEKGMMDEALAQFQEAVELRPDFPEAEEYLGDVLLAKSRTAEALEHLQRSADLQPRNAAAQYNFGDTVLQLGLAPDALAYFKKALALRPDYAEAQSEMGNAFQAMKQLSNAIACYQAALHLRPDFLPALNNLAWLFATTRDPSLRNGAKAVDLAQRAVKLSGGTRPPILGTLAAAHAETGDFRQATDLAKQALAVAVEQGNAAFADTLRAQIKQYEAGQPVRE